MAFFLVADRREYFAVVVQSDSGCWRPDATSSTVDQVLNVNRCLNVLKQYVIFSIKKILETNLMASYTVQ